MSDIYIAGIAMTAFGRHLERSVDDLAGEALRGALKDVGCGAEAIGAAFYAGITGGPLQGQLSIPGQVVFSKIGIEGIPVYNVENACASGSTAVHLAVQALRSRACDVALALGAEKMNVLDKAKLFALFEAGWDVARVDENFANLLKLGEGVVPPPGSESERPYSRFMSVYAALCRYHMKSYGTTQRQIAAVSSKNHLHSVHNPYSQFARLSRSTRCSRRRRSRIRSRCPCARQFRTARRRRSCALERACDASVATAAAASGLWLAWSAASRIVAPTSRRRTSAALRRCKPTSRRVSVPMTWMSPRCTTRRRWAKSSRPKTSNWFR